MRFLLSESTGWAAAALIGVTVLIAYVLRERMAPHYWIGYAIAGLTVVHAWLSMSPGSHTTLFVAGIWIASGAMLVVFAQVTTGLRLRDMQGPARQRQRRLHFWIMALLVTAGAVHVVLNGALIHRLTGLGG